MSDIVQHQLDDDGFGGGLSGGRLIKGLLSKWSSETGWVDRDGAALPEQHLVIKIGEALQRWQDGKPSVITDLPLPNEDDLNAGIPQSEWELDMTGKPRPPWQHIVTVVSIDPVGGGFFTYIGNTIGGHIAVDALKEAVISMRMLKRSKVSPIVKLGERPMKTRFGLKSRPSFDIVGWREPDNNDAALGQAPEPQRIAAPIPEQAQPQGSITIDPPVAKPTVDIPAAAEAKPAKGKGKAQSAKPTASAKPGPDDGGKPALDDPIPFMCEWR